jgi:Zn-dependent protease
MKFSQIEKEHLLKAWVAISFAFAVLNSSLFSSNFTVYFLISLLTVGIGFLLHELAHKYVAQKYGCWAEFRADDRMLIFAIVTAFLGFLFVAPGAVFIKGHVTIEKNGKISLAGPLTNIILALIFLGLFTVMPQSLSIVAYFGFKINAFIALFNMIPFLNIDGQKILNWNKTIYISVLLVAILLQLPVVEVLANSV